MRPTEINWGPDTVYGPFHRSNRLWTSTVSAIRYLVISSTVNRQPSTFNSQLRSCTHHLRSIVLLRYPPLEALDTFIRCLRTFTLHVSVFRVEPYLPILLSSWLEYNVLLSSDKWLSFSCCLVLLRWLESRYRRNHNYTAFTLILNELSNFSIFNSGIYPQKSPESLKERLSESCA
jgi:hypothetical protein